MAEEAEEAEAVGSAYACALTAYWYYVFMSEVLSVMSELGVEVDIFDGSYPYVRIERQPLSKVIVPNEQNYRYLSAWREEFGEGHERDLMRWGDWRLPQENPIEGPP